MMIRENTRKEIESKFLRMGDYVRIDYLSSCLKNNLDFDTRKFVLVKLAGLFETKGMFNDAAKAMKSAAEINTNLKNKISDFMKAGELFIKAGDYEIADVIIKRMVSLAEGKQIIKIEENVRNIYKTHARMCIDKNKRKQAICAYEKLLTLDMNDAEKGELQRKLLTLYEQVGDISQYNKLKKKIIN